MKPLIERPQYVAYITGKQIGSSEFNNGATDIFGDNVWEDVIRDECNCQPSLPKFMDFDPMYYQKVHPIELISNEAKYLKRETDIKNVLPMERRIL